MRLFVVALTLVLALGSTALAQTVDLRAPDQQVGPAQQAVVSTDLRAPDQQVGPTQQQPVARTDLRAPDQQAPVATPTSPVAPDTDGGPATLVLVLIGLGAASVLVAGGYVAVRHRHGTTIGDDLVTS